MSGPITKSTGKSVTSATGPPTFTRATMAQAIEIIATMRVCTKSDATTPHAPDNTDTNSTVRPVAIMVILISVSNTALEKTPSAFNHTPAFIILNTISAHEKNCSFWLPKRRLIPSVGVSTRICLKRAEK